MINTQETSQITKIYLVTNCFGDPNKVYVGKEKTQRIKSRFYDHKKFFGNQIIFTYIDEINSLKKEDWKPLECFWIEYFRYLGFDLQNKNNWGGGPSFHTEYTKNIISNINKGRKYSSETLTKMSLSQKGKTINERTRELFKITNKDKRNIPIIQYDLKGNFINEFKSITYASEVLNLCRQSINNCCLGKYSSTNGFTFRYKNDNNIFCLKPRKIQKKILQLDLEGNLIKEWEGVKQASLELKININSISSCCNQKRQNQAGGFKWKFK